MERDTSRAWRPRVPGIAEVFCAHFVHHCYPMHTHDSWTLLIVDSGSIGYELAGREHGSMVQSVTLLPPHVPHDGHGVGAEGFRKRVLYVDHDMLTGAGRAVGMPTLDDIRLRDRLNRLHRTLTMPGDEFEAASRLAFVLERVQWHLDGAPDFRATIRDRSIAHELREMLDATVIEGITLNAAAQRLRVDVTHLVREFSREFGLPPHRYVIGRKVDAARRMLLDGRPPAETAAAAGFYDQSHLNRHFKSMVGTTPGRYARSGEHTGH